MDTTDFHRSLSSKKAFETLMREIGDIVKAKRPSHNFLALVRRYLLGSSLRNVGSGVEPGWSHAVVMLCGVVLIVVGSLVGRNDTTSFRTSRAVGEGCVLIIVGCFNLVLCVREAYAQDVELMDRLSDLSAQYLDILHSHGGQKAWPFQSVDPTCNSSPPITLIHVYRDGVLGHIPANLLVELDLIQLAVGHIAPANIRCVELGSQEVKYKRGETILPLPMAVEIAGDDDEIKCPNQTRQRFVVEETPIVSDILRFLERRANRPIPHLAVKLQVLSRYIQAALVVAFVTVELINVARYFTISAHAGVWSEMFLVLPIYAVLPMLPLSLPFLWYMMNAFGVAHILATYDMLLETDYAPQAGHRRHSDFGMSAPQDNEIPMDGGWVDEGSESDSSLDDSFDQESRSSSAHKHTSTFPSTQRTEKVYVPRLFQVMRRVFQVWYGSAYATLPRSSSLFLEMGSITVVCTVDKEGVLSYPTPSVEKVFLPGSGLAGTDSLDVPGVSPEDIGKAALPDDITDGDLDVTDAMTPAEYSASEGRYTPSPDSKMLELARHSNLPPRNPDLLDSQDTLAQLEMDAEQDEHLKLSQSVSVPANMALAKDPLLGRQILGGVVGSSFSTEHLKVDATSGSEALRLCEANGAHSRSVPKQRSDVAKQRSDTLVVDGALPRVDLKIGADSDVNESCEDDHAERLGRNSLTGQTNMDIDKRADKRRVSVTKSMGKETEERIAEGSGDEGTEPAGVKQCDTSHASARRASSGFVPEATDADGELDETETDEAMSSSKGQGSKGRKSKAKSTRRQSDFSLEVTDSESGKPRGRSGGARRSLMSLMGRSSSQVRVSEGESTHTDNDREKVTSKEKNNRQARDSDSDAERKRDNSRETGTGKKKDKPKDKAKAKAKAKDSVKNTDGCEEKEGEGGGGGISQKTSKKKGTYMRNTSLTDEPHGGRRTSNTISTTRSTGYTNKPGQSEHNIHRNSGPGDGVLYKSYSSFGPSDDEDLSRFSTAPADVGLLDSASKSDLKSSINAHTIVKSTHSFTHASKSPRMRYRKQHSSVETTVSVIVPNKDAPPPSAYNTTTPKRRHRPRFYSADEGQSPSQSDRYFLPPLRRNKKERPESYSAMNTSGANSANNREMSQSEGDDSDEQSEGNANGNTTALIVPRVKISFTSHPNEVAAGYSYRKPRRDSLTVTGSTGLGKDYDPNDYTDGKYAGSMTVLDPVLMDIAHDRRLKYGFKFTDSDWQSRLSLLKPLGLNVLLNTNCHRPWLSMRHADLMRYITYVELNKVLTSRKRCLCLLAKTIGFADSSLQKYRRRQQIWTFAKEVARPVEQEIKRTAMLESQDDRDRGEPVPSMISQLVEETDTGTFHIMSEGSAPLVLQTCTDYFDGNSVNKLTDADRRRILEFYQTMSTRMLVIAFSYRPIHRSHDWFNHNNPVAIAYSENAPKKLAHERSRNGQVTQKEIRYKCRQMIEHQIFTGMVAVQRQARETVVKVVSNLDTAGIRFVFFSQQDSGSSTAFAETLGLPTGWNTSISLNENTTDTATEGPSQLPRGIQNIRPHLEKVDDVPLLIQLFTDCTVEATGEMISIMQEHGEVVCCIGSSLRSQNMLLFSQADISIGIEPLAPKNCLNIDASRLFTSTPKTPAATLPASQAADLANTTLNTIQTMMQTVRFYQEADVPVLALSAELNNIGCSLAIGKQTNLYVVMHLIASARYCLMNAHKIFFFVIGSNLTISLLMVLNALFLYPPVLTGADILWLTLVQFPLATIPIWGSRVGSVMHLMPDKNNRQLKDVSRHTIHGAVRFGPTSAVVLAVFASCLYGLCESVIQEEGLTSACTYYGPADVTGGRTWTGWGTAYAKGLRTAQLLCCTMLAIYAIPLSATFLHRTLPVWKCKMQKQYLWMGVSVLILVLQFLYVLVSETIDGASTPKFGWGDIPWYAYLVAVLWIPVLVLLNEGAKMIYKKRFTLLQKRARLLFDTKLGMHSPI